MRKILMFVPLLFLACKTIKIEPKNHREIKVKDTVFTTLKVVDTLRVLRETDTARIQLPVHKVTSKPIVKKSKHATLKIQKVGGQLQIECVADELREIIEIQKETISHYRELYEKEEERVVVKQSKIPVWVQPFLWIGVGALVVVILKLIK